MKLYFVFTLFLVLASAMVSSAGKDGCICTFEYNPVCGKDGKTYGNSCQAACAGVKVAYQGECCGDS